MLKKIYFLLIIFSVTAFSQSFVKYGNEFLTIGVGGKQLSMGGAGLSINRDVTAGYWNPAGLADVKESEIILQHDERYGDLVNFDYGAVAYSYKNQFTLGLSVIRLGIDGIPDTRNALVDSDGNGVLDNYDRLDYTKVTYNNASDWAFIFTYAKKSSEKFSYGANVKIIYRDLMSNSAFGVGFDAGVIYSPLDKLYLGASVLDITTTYLAWNTGTKELISPTLKLGTGYNLDIFNGVLTPAIDFDMHFDGRNYASIAAIGPVGLDMHAGMEFLYKNIIALRAGYNDVKQLTLGIGLKIFRLDLDYAFAKFSAENDLGNTHRISLKMNLGNISL
jgi:hypothetical protein